MGYVNDVFSKKLFTKKFSLFKIEDLKILLKWVKIGI